ncbi:MAG TPA: MogA/MoaB family molybdenum cofactor biosynthesis protein [Bacillota bacterium]|nr:MogA/MoaB family molybdenum cofactor biosynthesis protein [Bacillota bacterium]
MHGIPSFSVRCLILTISDTRSMKTDKSGQLIQTLLCENDHEVVERKVIPDNMTVIRSSILEACRNPDIDVILTTGGTGISYRDVTIETIDEILDKELTGFGELFRMLSYTEDIGAAAMMSRAIAGSYKHKAIFAMPGSSGAVKLALNKLILPELSHVVYEIQKDISK